MGMSIAEYQQKCRNILEFAAKEFLVEDTQEVQSHFLLEALILIAAATTFTGMKEGVSLDMVGDTSIELFCDQIEDQKQLIRQKRARNN